MAIERPRMAAEAVLALVAAAACLGWLGSTELWGKREQRAAAEALDTVDRGHWLVAEIQGRPRLEKPPLPRWITASLIRATGRRDEVVVRLPNALAALLTVGLVYLLGRGMGGRSVGLASGFALASSAYFLIEMRQAGNDGLLTLFTTLALLAGWRRLHGGEEHGPGSRGWNLVFGLALGLGFLCKGPIILLLVAVPVVGALATARRLAWGLRLLADWRALALFLALAVAWPVPVLLRDPMAGRVWWLELGQKTGAAGIVHGNARGSVVLDWPWMTLPWTPLAMLAAAGPWRRSARIARQEIGFAWWWAVGNLAILGTWSVAKPSYYLPCLPGVALLVGSEWVRLARLARSASTGPGSIGARLLIQGTWVAAFALALIAPVAVGEVAPGDFRWACVGGGLLAGSAVAGAWAWHRGRDAAALAWPAAGLVAVALIGYGAIAPGDNPTRGHKALAAELSRIVPAGTPVLWFFDELDEGLWFYLRDINLTPLASSGPTRYNRGFDLRATAPPSPSSRVDQARTRLADWAQHADPASPYVLIRAKLYDRPGFVDRELAPLIEPVYRERGVKRNEMVLLRARPPTGMASASASWR